MSQSFPWVMTSDWTNRYRLPGIKLGFTGEQV